MATSGQDSISFLEQGAIQSLDQAIDKMRQLVDLIDKSANASKILNAAMTGNQGGSVAKTVQDMDELAKINVKVADLTRKIAAAHTEYNVVLQAQKNILRDVNKEASNKAKMQVEEEGSYNSMSASLERMTRQYKAMSEAQRQAVGGDLVKRIQETDAALKKLDATMGVHRRNVGNYQGAVFSLSQVIRELPAFTYSAQMGFMAIGNNMPILIDQFKLLKAEVGSTGKALKIFAGSIFSFVNVFTILTGLFTIYYKEIMNFINPTNEAAEALKKVESATRDARVGVLGLQDALKLAESGIISKSEFTKQYNKVLGDVVGKTEDYTAAIGNTLEYSNQYLLFLEARTKMELAYNAAIDARKAAADFPEFIENSDIWDKFKAKGSAIANSLSGGVMTAFTPIGIAQMTRALFGDTRQQYAAFYKAQQDAAKQAEKAASDAMADYLKKGVPFNKDAPSGGKGRGASSPTIKEANRIRDMKEAFETELNELEILRVKENMSDLEYYQQSLNKRRVFSDELDKMRAENVKLTKDEKKDLEDVQADTLKSLAKYIEDIKKLLPQRQVAETNQGDAFWSMVFGDDFMKRAQQMGAQLEREAQQLKESYVDIARSSADLLMNIQDGFQMQDMLVFDQRERRLKDYYDNELRFIEQSGMATEEKEKAKQELEAITEAKRKKIDYDRVTALRKQAIQNKALTVAAVTLETTLAVMAAYSNKTTLLQPLRVANAIAAGLVGAAQIAKALAAPLPQYAKGRGKGKAEWAEVGEAGLEVIARGSGKVEVVDRPTITHLAPDDQVFNKDQIVKAVQNAAYVKLSQHSTVTTDKLQSALLQAFEENTHELRQVKQIIADKKFTATVTQLSQYEAYKNENIR